VDGGAVTSRRLEHTQDLPRPRAWRIGHEHADSQRPSLEPVLYATDDLLHFGIGRGPIGGGACWLGRTRVAQRGPARLDMTDADAVVDRALSRALGVPAVDVARPLLELERRGDAVEDLDAIGLGRLGVLVEIDESRRDDEPARVDCPTTAQGTSRDTADASP